MKNIKNKRLFSVLPLTLTMLCVGANNSVAAQFQDDFNDGNRDGWYITNGTDFMDLSVVDDAGGLGSGNALRLDASSGSGRRSAHTTFDPVTLNQAGDWVQLTFDVRFGTPLPTNAGRQLNFGLWDSDGGSVTADGDSEASGMGYHVAAGAGENTLLSQNRVNIFNTQYSTDAIVATGERLTGTDPASYGLRIERTAHPDGGDEDLTFSILFDGTVVSSIALTDDGDLLASDGPLSPLTYTFGDIHIGVASPS